MMMMGEATTVQDRLKSNVEDIPDEQESEKALLDEIENAIAIAKDALKEGEIDEALYLYVQRSIGGSGRAAWDVQIADSDDPVDFEDYVKILDSDDENWFENYDAESLTATILSAWDPGYDWISDGNTNWIVREHGSWRLDEDMWA